MTKLIKVGESGDGGQEQQGPNLNDFVQAILGKDNIEDTIYNFMPWLDKERLNSDQQAGVQNLVDLLQDVLTGCLRTEQVMRLLGLVEEIKDIPLYTQEDVEDQELRSAQVNLKSFVVDIRTLALQNPIGGENEDNWNDGEPIPFAEIRKIKQYWEEALLEKFQGQDKKTLEGVFEYLQSVIDEQGQAQETIVEKVLIEENGLSKMLTAVLIPEFQKGMGVAKNLIRTAESETVIRQLVRDVVQVLLFADADQQEKAKEVNRLTEAASRKIIKAQSKSSVVDVLGMRDEDPAVNFMTDRTLCPTGKKAKEIIDDLSPEESINEEE